MTYASETEYIALKAADAINRTVANGLLTEADMGIVALIVTRAIEEHEAQKPGQCRCKSNAEKL